MRIRVKTITVYSLAIPFVEEFAHASMSRNISDSIVLKVETDEGVEGWGETLVRPYVSGETVPLATDLLKRLKPLIEGRDFEIDPSAPDPVLRLAALTEALEQILSQERLPPEVRTWNGVRCALELSILDALLRTHKQNISLILAPVRRELFYSGVISSGSDENSLKIARQMKQLGIRDYKVKVAHAESHHMLRELRALLGPEVTIRLDANKAFSVSDALSLSHAAFNLDIKAIEEPLVERSELPLLQAKSPIPLMVDESLVTEEDAKELIRQKACGFFNIRLAKCGGLAQSLRMIDLARKAGLAYQIGALVGETAILSAASRALAAHVEDCRFLEGSFGTLLLKEDISAQSIRFGFGGKATVLKGLGLGPEINESLVIKYQKG